MFTETPFDRLACFGFKAGEADTDCHPVCALVLKQLGAGRDGAEVKGHFEAPPFGWQRDVVDGALFALLAGGHPHQKLADEARAIADQRAMLAAHDPVQALLDKTVDLLRNSLNHHVQQYRDTLAREQAELDQDADWQRLDDTQRGRILAERHLTVAVETASPESILAELERCALSQWIDRT